MAKTSLVPLVLPANDGNENNNNAATTAFVRSWVNSVYPGWKRASEWVLFDDFLNAATGSVLAAAQSGTGAGASVGQSDASHPGLLTLSTGTTATGRAGVLSGASIIRFGGGLITLEILLNIAALSNATDRYIIRAGLIDSISADAVDGAYFEYDESTSPNWRTCTASNSTRTKTNSSQAVQTGWHKLRLDVYSDGSGVDYYYDGSYLRSETTSIPTAAGRETGIGIWIAKSVGITARTVDVDYVHLRQTFGATR
ncbi:MAG TPA: hypothetical protein VNQ79_15875 [Blastocatellia bacterium]|nr:hypothetical protein [Blastocatellia bacterium]